MNTGNLYIISAPSGAGKTSLVKKLITEVKQISVSVSHTTRSIRPGESDGIDYFFTSADTFQQMIAQQAFLEHAQVFDNLYGTAQQTVEDFLEKGLDVILEIDWQGAQQIRKILPNCISIFILPPSIDVLQQRLLSRGQDSTDVINRRMRDAINEMNHYDQFDYLIVNDDFNLALTELKCIILSHRLKQQRQQHKLAPLLSKLTTSDENHYYY